MKKETVSDRAIQLVLNLPLEEIAEISVEKIAFTLKVNRSYLSRKFKQEKDLNLCEFLNREKLLRSIGLLRENHELTVNEISTKMGFANTNYFIQIFKRFIGTPPGKYREYIKQ